VLPRSPVYSLSVVPRFALGPSFGYLGAVELTDLEPASLARLEEAVRDGQRVTLNLQKSLPRGLRADDVMPLFEAITGGPPAAVEALGMSLPPRARGGKKPKVCAVIPTHRRAPLGLKALLRQDCDLEVLILLNGDFEFRAGDPRVRTLRVPWQGHGTVRQAAVTQTDAEFLLFTVDDAIPLGAGSVRALVDALKEGQYEAVFGRQVPWPSSDRITRDRLRAWTPPGVGHRWVDRLDNVYALYRREMLAWHPFPSVPIAEDLHWRRGRRVGYVPGAPVAHAHERKPGELYKRTRDIHRQHIALGEPPAIPTHAHLLRALPSVLGPMLKGGAQELPNQLAELLGQWRAGTHPTG